MSFPFQKEREYFPILHESIQLSSCSQSAMSVQVETAIQEYIDSWRFGGMDWVAWMNRVEAAKGAFARIINASPDDIAVLSSVSDVASAVASGLNFSGPRNKIVTTEMDFPCIGHVWLAQEKIGAKVEFVPSDDSHLIPLDYYKNAIDSSTLITSVPHVTYYNGFKQDIKAIADIAHEQGSYLFVDAYQSAGSVAIDVKEMDVDFLASGSQKYLLGIPGIAFLYVRKEAAQILEPKVTGWFGRINPFAMDPKGLDYAEGARRFDTGTPPMINAYAAHAAFELILSVGVDRIEEYLGGLSRIAIQCAEKNGLTVVSPKHIGQKAANTAIRVPNASELERKMKEKGFIVAARSDVIRIAPHFYNTEDDVVSAIENLAHLLQRV